MSHRYLPLLLLVLAWPAQGEIFKCESPSGELTFSQTPCPEKDSKVTVERSVSTSPRSEVDCEMAHRFALATAREMQSGVPSADLFDRYGGLSALSRGSVSLISYVYQYRTKDDISVERVAALSVAKCKAKSFGDVSCEQLPSAYTSSLGGCEQIAENGGAEAIPLANASTTTAQAFSVEPEPVRQQTDAREAREREEAQHAACKARIRSQIDNINSQLRAGYSASQGTRLRERRRDLEQKLREC